MSLVAVTPYDPTHTETPNMNQKSTISAKKTPLLGLGKRINQFVQKDIKGAFNGKPDSFARGALLRIALGVVPMITFGILPRNQIADKIISQLGWETAYQIINRTGRSRGGNLFPQIADRYEKRWQGQG